jgi:hypothetical protein
MDVHPTKNGINRYWSIAIYFFFAYLRICYMTWGDLVMVMGWSQSSSYDIKITKQRQVNHWGSGFCRLQNSKLNISKYAVDICRHHLLLSHNLTFFGVSIAFHCPRPHIGSPFLVCEPGCTARGKPLRRPRHHDWNTSCDARPEQKQHVQRTRTKAYGSWWFNQK